MKNQLPVLLILLFSLGYMTFQSFLFSACGTKLLLVLRNALASSFFIILQEREDNKNVIKFMTKAIKLMKYSFLGK